MFRQVKLPSPTTNHRHFLCFCTFFVVYPSRHLCCDQTILNLTKLYIQILFNYGVIISSEITFGRFLVIRRLQMWLFVKVRWFLNVDFKMILYIIYTAVGKFRFYSDEVFLWISFCSSDFIFTNLIVFFWHLR